MARGVAADSVHTGMDGDEVKRALTLAGWLYFLAYLCLYSGGAHAETRYELVLMIYTTADGHGTTFKSYRDIVHLPDFEDLKTCTKAGHDALYWFHSRENQADLSRDLLDFYCLKIGPAH